MKADTFEMTVKTFFGLEDVLVEELKEIGAENIKKGNRVVTFEGDKRLMYKANLWLRTGLKVLKPVKSFRAESEEELYQQIKRMNWAEYMDNDMTFAIDSTVKSSVFRHSKYAALKVKDAIADYFRSKTGKRPSVSVENPDLRIHIHIADKQCILSLDSSGDSLHKRGYRKARQEAPLNEILAAALIKLSGWKCNTNFLDPMCGSGTILIEAGLIAFNIAPGLKRSFGFQNWKDYDETLWTSLLGEALTKKRDFNHKILGSDLSEDAIEVAADNIENAGLEDDIRIRKVSVLDRTRPDGDAGIIVMNPPYGERIGERVELLYKMIGSKLKSDFEGYDVWIISSNKDALKQVGLQTSRKMTVYNGGLECKFQKYEMYRGSKKRR